MAYTDDSGLPEISDEAFRATLQTIRPYTIVILKSGPHYSPPGPDRDPQVTAHVISHAKRNLALKTAGFLPIVCPIGDGTGITGLYIFNAEPEEAERIMDADPGVKAGVFTYEIHPTQSFPKSCLPE
jgi:hypothetical protein